MGLLVDGHWRDRWYDTKSTGGRYVRKDSQFRNRITADGSSGFKAESGRYHPTAKAFLLKLLCTLLRPLSREDGQALPRLD